MLVFGVSSLSQLATGEPIKPASEQQKPRIVPVETISFSELNVEKKFPQLAAGDVKRLPKFVRQLDGKLIEIEAWMYPPYKDSDIRRFVVVPDRSSICPPYHPSKAILVTMREGITADYVKDESVTLVGKFEIRPEVIDGELQALYHLTEVNVVPVR